MAKHYAASPGIDVGALNHDQASTSIADTAANQARLGLFSDFTNSVANSFTSQANGVIQLFGGKQIEQAPVDKADFGSAAWASELAGQAVGIATEFALLRAGFSGIANNTIRCMSGGAITDAATSVAGRTLIGAGTGAFMGTVLTPSAHGEGYAMLQDRLKQGISYATAFGITSGVAAGAEKAGASLSESATRSALATGETSAYKNVLAQALQNGYAAGALGGFPGGAIGAAVETKLNGDNLSGKQLAQLMGERGIEFAFVGLGAHALSRGGAALSDAARNTALDYADQHIDGQGASQRAAKLIRSHVSEPISYVPVTEANLAAATQASMEGFSYAKGLLNPSVDFKASLDAQYAESLYGDDPHAPKNMHYFAAVDRHGKIAGTTGLYNYEHDQDATWLGWYSVRPEARGRGIGNQLLDFSISKARESGRPLMRLYTSDHPGERVAQHLYDRSGLNVTSIDPPNEAGVSIIYREKSLRSPLQQKIEALKDSLFSRTKPTESEPEGSADKSSTADRSYTSDKTSWVGKDGASYHYSTPDIRENVAWHPIYESNFPESERQPYEFLEKLSEPGAVPQVRLQATDRNGQTSAFSVTSDYGEGDGGRKLLIPYIGVDQSMQSSGIGSQHLARLVDSLKEQYQTAPGMILEMEPTDEKDLSPEALDQRQKRLRFWTRNGAQVIDGVDYEIPSSIEGEPPIALKLLWMDFGRGGLTRPHLQDLVGSIYKHGYELSDDDPLVKQFNSQFENDKPGGNNG